MVASLASAVRTSTPFSLQITLHNWSHTARARATTHVRSLVADMVSVPAHLCVQMAGAADASLTGVRAAVDAASAAANAAATSCGRASLPLQLPFHAPDAWQRIPTLPTTAVMPPVPLMRADSAPGRL
jgi:hypothetical protein